MLSFSGICGRLSFLNHLPDDSSLLCKWISPETYILAYLYRAFFVKQLISFQVKIYLKDVIIPITIISLALILIGFLSYSMITNYIISSLVMFICSTIFIWVMGLNAHERKFIFQEIHKKLPRKWIIFSRHVGVLLAKL